MIKVWVDFPRQKLLKSNKGYPNLLLNYMSLDKRPRYKTFFDEVN